MARHARLEAKPPGELPDQHAHREHHREGEQVLDVGRDEAEARWDEEELEGEDVDRGTHDRGPAPETHREQHDRDRVDHRDRRELEGRIERRREGRGTRAGEHGPDVTHALFARAGRVFRGARSRSLDRHARIGAAPPDLDQVEARGPARDPLAHAALQPRAARLAHDRCSDVLLARVVHDRLGDVVARDDRGIGPELARETHDTEDARALLGRQALQARRLDVDRGPRNRKALGVARRASHHVLGALPWSHAAQQAPLRLPDGVDALLDAVFLHLVLDHVGRAPQRDLAKRKEASLAEVGLLDALLGFAHVDHARLLAQEQLVGGHVHHHRFVGRIEERIGHRQWLADAGDLADHVVQALEVLHAHRREHVDARGEQLVGVLPALGMAPTPGIGVREIVHEDHVGMAYERPVEIELARGRSPVARRRRQRLESLEQLEVRAFVRIDDADHDVPSRLAHPLRGGEHRVGLAGARKSAEEDLEPAARHPFSHGGF